MSSAFIYVVIVAMWVAYFVPRWRARNDEVSGKNADRFRNAIKMVSEDFSQNPPVPTKERPAVPPLPAGRFLPMRGKMRGKHAIVQ